jgi:molecular chaperone DnaJ
MQLKDYYKTLNIPPTAGPNEIRKAFRLLALRYHPDKNNGDKYKEALFREVQEAYETLSDTKSREEYNYKRWYTRSLGKTFREVPVNPTLILAEVRKLADYTKSLNNVQIDYDVLSTHIRAILSTANIDILHQFNNSVTNEQIVRLLLDTSAALPRKYFEPISLLLVQLAGANEALLQEIRATVARRTSDEFWQKHTWWLVLLAAAFICCLMYLYAS